MWAKRDGIDPRLHITKSKTKDIARNSLQWWARMRLYDFLRNGQNGEAPQQTLVVKLNMQFNLSTCWDLSFSPLFSFTNWMKTGLTTASSDGSFDSVSVFWIRLNRCRPLSQPSPVSTVKVKFHRKVKIFQQFLICDVSLDKFFYCIKRRDWRLWKKSSFHVWLVFNLFWFWDLLWYMEKKGWKT